MKIIRKMITAIVIIVSIVIIGGLLFVSLSPEFGGSATKEKQQEYEKSAHHKDGKFINLGNVNTTMKSGDMLKAIGGMLKSIPNTTPNAPMPIQKIDSTTLADYSDNTRFIWFGHSAFLVQINGKNILLDPMLGEVPAPHPWLGGKRFSKELPIEIEKLPRIDAVLISHDHYDHLDYGSIRRLKSKVNHYYTPLGLGNHLLKWGIPKENITELDWWQSATLDGLTFTSTPAQHFSGRGLSDRDKTLWCSWVLQSPTENIFFSGDSGYAPHFKEIGEKFGEFDFAMMECGQYNKLWSTVHMFPEETAQAGVDLNAKKIMPIHWGAFKLAQHSWTDPVERVYKKAKELDIELITPEIGEPFTINQSKKAYDHWWDAL